MSRFHDTPKKQSATPEREKCKHCNKYWTRGKGHDCPINRPPDGGEVFCGACGSMKQWVTITARRGAEWICPKC